MLAGVAVALGVAELSLRPFRSTEGPPTPSIESDSFAGATIERRQLDEGISVAHFSASGARLTGNEPLPDAPTIVLLGDSYVVARAIGDTETMGSRVERLARRHRPRSWRCSRLSRSCTSRIALDRDEGQRAAGARLNVRQYGWSGASPSRYLVVADTVLRRWTPADVVIALSDNDMDANALNGAVPRLQVTRANTLEVLPATRPAPPGEPPSSVLVSMLEERTWEFRSRVSRGARLAVMAPAEAAPPPLASADVLSDSEQLELLPGAVVRALAAAYGPRLALVYLAEVRLSGDTAITPIEERLLAACRAESVRCASTRDVMVAARSNGHIARGFTNTTPGNGHLNAFGHALAADVIWRLLRAPRRAPEPAGER